MAVDARDLALEGFWPGRVDGYSIAGSGAFNTSEGVGAEPSAPAPGALPFFGGGDGGRYADREESHADFLRDVERLHRENGEVVDLPSTQLVEVRATSLAVDIRATFLDVRVVERGNLIEFFAPFSEPPDDVCFVFTMPGTGRPVVYSFGQPDSRIEQLSDLEYLCTIDTTGFSGGAISWHFWGTRDGVPVGSDFGDEENGRAIAIPSRSARLL